MFWGATSLTAQNITDALRPFRGVSGLGARAIALGGAYTSVSNDFTATFWNPAGLAQIQKSSVYTSIGHLAHNADISFGPDRCCCAPAPCPCGRCGSGPEIRPAGRKHRRCCRSRRDDG